MTGPSFEESSPARAVALAVRFLLELALLASAALVAWWLTQLWWSALTALLAVVAVAVIWGLFVSPKAAVPLPPAAVLTIEAVLFVGVGAALVFVGGFVVPAIVLVGGWLVDRVALAIL
ncbi:MAG: DUF2568 domain-containing protein [Arachnia sp.]